MPKDFTSCVKAGGKVITENLKGNRYRHVCFNKSGRHEGEIKTRKKKSKSNRSNKRRRNNKRIKDSKALVADLKRLKNHFDENYRN